MSDLIDNVGGDILDLMLTRMKRHGRIAVWYAHLDIITALYKY